MADISKESTKTSTANPLKDFPKKAYSPEEFLSELEAGAFDPPLPLTWIGMAHQREGDRRHILIGQRCGDWTPIPISIIESVTPFGWSTCDSHTHPLVKLRLKEPATEDAKAFAQLATSHRRAFKAESSPPSLPPRWREDTPGGDPTEHGAAEYTWSACCGTGHGFLGSYFSSITAYAIADQHAQSSEGACRTFVVQNIFGEPGGYWPCG
ncbi:hypothetical protein ACFYUK_19175 [Nonomuraea wenchangensis]